MIVDKSIQEIKEGWNLTLSSLLAGFCISIGCIVNLMVGGGIPGAVLFTFGLITVVHYKYALYTGTAGFIKNFDDLLVFIQDTLEGRDVAKSERESALLRIHKNQVNGRGCAQ